MNPKILYSADVSSDGVYRYSLARNWQKGPQLLFIMLNPSTADSIVDDPTIRKCMEFGRRLGFGGITVGNLFAFRSKDPKLLKTAANPVGPLNDEFLANLYAESTLTIAAWGNHGGLWGRGEVIRQRFPALFVFRLTKQGQPEHPLYMPLETYPFRWNKK